MPHVPSKLRKKIEWLLRRAEGALLPDRLLGAEAAHLDPDAARLALRAAADDVAIVGANERLDDLLARSPTYAEEHGVAGVRRFRAGTATRIYQIAVETFPRHVNNVYLVIEGTSSLLFDAGSGMPTSRRDLALGFAVVREVFGEVVRWEDVGTCVVSHAHSDHFGGVNELKRTSRASVAVHELDARVLERFEERLVSATKDIDAYWERAGVDASERAALRELYGYAKQLFRSERVDRTLRDGDRVGDGYRVHHVPGHCPGLVCLRVHDVLLTSDHVLARITPHQFPAALAPFAGLAHYFDSLAKIRAVEGISFGLGGHEGPIADLAARVDEIAAFHRARLARVASICEASPRTIQEIARELFGEQEGYGVILALDEAGAHVEYLEARGAVRATTEGGVTRYATRTFYA